MSFTVRLANLADAEAVTAVLAASYPALMAGHYDPDVLAGLIPLITTAQPKLLASGRYYVAVAADGAVVGCGGWSHERPGSGGIEPGLGHIRHFATHPDWTGRGVGRALFARCAADAARDGVTRFECNSNLNAEGFYRTLGFLPVRRIMVPISPGHQLAAVMMRLGPQIPD
jgi:GNAT superfamily N-acetyltransferase